MERPGFVMQRLCGAACLLIASSAFAQSGQPGFQSLPINRAEAVQAFQDAHPANGLVMEDGRVSRIHGAPFAQGVNALDTAEQVRLNNAAVWGVLPADLAPIGPFEDGHHVQPIMYDRANGTYKFTGVYYRQQRDGIPVYGARVMTLVRNEPGYPAVLASADLRDIGAFHPNLASINQRQALAAVKAMAGADAAITGPDTVIWAGADGPTVAPVLALAYVVEGGNGANGTYFKVRVLVDAATGAVLHQENLVWDVDVTGNVSANATSGFAADACNPELLTPMPYAKVTIGATTAYCDANGNFTIPNAGSGSVTVNSPTAGLYFEVFNYNDAVAPATPDAATVLSQTVTPPGPVNFVHNAANDSENARAEVNAYIAANKVRDYLLDVNPSYPSIPFQTGFPATVNQGLTCNAFYNGSSINFYHAGGGCNNTAFSNVVYHEYGHHIVQMGGSGQGAYGEGHGDIIGVLVDDQPCLGDGFTSCGSCLRNADNNCQYQASGCSSCGSASHDCGRLISGCVWSTRNQLILTNPATYREILSDLAINAILLHSGSGITPSITVDWLTLDDDDADIANGTPHYAEVNAGFSAHNMAAPPLAAVLIKFPNGKPALVSPSGGSTVRVNVLPGTGTPQPGTGKFFYDIGGGFVQGTMNIVSPNVYDAVFPAAPCGVTVKWYVSAQSTTLATVSSPSNAPAGFNTATSAAGLGLVTFNDDFEGNNGWTVSNGAGLTGGAWDKGVPFPQCDRGNPLQDADGSGQCFLTQNSVNANDCNTDVDGGATTLTSPAIDVTQGPSVLSYARWYSNTQGSDPENDTFVIEFSINDGSTWLPLETVGPNSGSPNPQIDGGWYVKSFNLQSLAGFAPTNKFRVRFKAADLNSGSVVEAGIDAVKVQTLVCVNQCQADLNGNDQVDIDDLFSVINAWGPCSGCVQDIDDNGQVDIDDLFTVINAWGACP